MSSYWQGKGAGKRIAIRFTKPLLGDVTGNETAFTVKGMVRSPLEYGPLVERTFDVESVERYPIERYWRDEFDGDMDGLEAGEYGLRLGGEVGNALSFDGDDDYVGLSMPLSIFSSAFTVEMWVYHEGGKRGVLLGDWQLSNGINVNFELTIDDKLRLFWSGLSIIGTGSVVPSRWNHVAFVRNKTTDKVYFYINGNQDAMYGGVLSDRAATIGHYIGRDSRTGETALKGTIDDVRVWNVARTQQQIADNMNKELTGNETGLVGYWKFNEGSGLTAYDSAGSNNGTIYGATWTDGIIGSYPDEGTYTLSLDATELPESPRFRCEASIPDDTAIVIEYTCTDGDEPDSEDWAEIEDGDLLTITGTTLWLRYTLTTDDPAVTPTLLSAWLEEPTAPPGTILLTMTPDSRFNDVEGDLTVSYEQATGTLTGTRPVEDFTESFTPTDLEPTPINVQGTITAGIEVEVDFIEVYYVDLGHKHTITAGITVEVDLIPVSGIPP
jgi:hypothetical protein